ncbi:MAG: 4-hydroxy-tetrahydrodipicolinate synthase [Clostridia bacterium]|nr:4-hydroxy-tetrahydrodipicolinate synthase [Clostridia bacterium]
MKQPIFRGCATALVTPFGRDGDIDFQSLGRLIEAQISGGVDALVVCGTTGESATLTDEEKLSVLEYAVVKTDGKVPVIAGTGSNDTARSVQLTKKAQSLGVDGILAVCPYYNKPGQDGILKHYLALADCGCPVLVYNVPGRTASAASPETLRELSKHENIVGLKDAGGSLQSAATVRNLCGDDLPLYSGDDGCIVPFLSIGGVGVISVLSNLFPKTVRTLCEAWFSGDVEKAGAEQIRIMPLVSALFSRTNPIPVKCGLEFFGYPPQNLRLPLCSLEEEEKKKLFALLCLRQREI